MTLVPPGQLDGQIGDVDALSGLSLATGGAGVVVGVDQYGGPVGVRLFRPEPTRAVAVGGLRFAQLLAFRALGVGARVVVRTERPSAWGAFARVTTVPKDAVLVLVPDAPAPTTEPDPGGPRLLLLDTGPDVTEGDPVEEAGYDAVLSVHDELTAWDVDRLTRADLVLLQPLTYSEATLVGSALKKPELDGTLARLQADMVTIVAHGTVRWARLAQTDVERHLIGPALRT